MHLLVLSLVAIAAQALAACSAEPAPSLTSADVTQPAPSPPPPFIFSRGGCELGAVYCALREPKDWADDEKALIESALAEISAYDLGRRILESAYEKGFRTLRRYRVHAVQTGPDKFEIPDDGRTLANQHADEHVRSIDMNDRFFRLRGKVDKRAGYTATTELILHEFFHAFDWARLGVYALSGSEDFQNRVGFRRLHGSSIRFQFMFPFQSQADRVNGLRSESLNRAKAGLLDEWWDMSRSDAWTPLPSEVAATSPKEAFAEIGAHLVLDPTARVYLDPKVLDYFESEVFRN